MAHLSVSGRAAVESGGSDDDSGNNEKQSHKWRCYCRPKTTLFGQAENEFCGVINTRRSASKKIGFLGRARKCNKCNT